MSRFIQWWILGDSSVSDSTRRINDGFYHLSTGGWAGFKSALVDPLLALGVKRFSMRQPFGYVAADGGTLPMNEWTAAQTNLPYITNDFVSTWSAVAALSGVEVIAYGGGPTTLPSSQYAANIQPYLDANLSMAFDYSSHLAAGTPGGDFIIAQKAAGRKIYVEAWPNVGTPYATYPWFIENFDYAAIIANFPSWAIPLNQQSGEVVVVVDTPPQGTPPSQPGWLVPAVNAALALGSQFSVATDIARFLAEGGVMNETVSASGVVARATVRTSAALTGSVRLGRG